MATHGWIRLRLLLALFMALGTPAVFAELDEPAAPRLELGAGVGGLVLPHYLGSDQDSSYALPIPYLIYRGEVVRADRNGLRGTLYESGNLAIRISLDASLPVNSDDNKAREGMDDLDTLVEFGPVIEYSLYRTEMNELQLKLPLRGVFSMGGQFLNHEGWTAQPRLEFTRFFEAWRWQANIMPIFGDARNHRYFYQIDAKDATAERPVFKAESGYTGTRVGGSLRYRAGANITGFSLSYYALDGADNRSSPLFLQNDALSISFYYARIFCSSSSPSIKDCR